MARENPQQWKAHINRTIARVIAVTDTDKLIAEQCADATVFSISERNIKVNRQTH
jgi:hypothetical protein